VPAIYQQSFGAVDPTNSGETSVNSLSRVLSTSSLPAATVDKVRHTLRLPLSLFQFSLSCSCSLLSSYYLSIPSSYDRYVVVIVVRFHWLLLFKIVNIVSTRPRVSKLEFFVALALVALAQTGKGT
jgi:sorting nexin-8